MYRWPSLPTSTWFGWSSAEFEGEARCFLPWIVLARAVGSGGQPVARFRIGTESSAGRRTGGVRERPSLGGLGSLRSVFEAEEADFHDDSQLTGSQFGGDAGED